MDGIFNIYKPPGMTSFDVVSRIRKELKIKKVGHTGTLDPMASGVLVVCTGKATRLSQYITGSNKSYIGELTLGYETDTQDIEGRVLRYSRKKASREEIIETFQSFIGELNQVPPMYSAVRYKGKRLYELARQGKTVERKSRKVTIYNLDIIKIYDNKVLFNVECSAGTYIRTLCNDIGYKLKTYGYMSYLLRTGVGNFRVEDSISLDLINRNNIDNMNSLILPMDKGLRDYPAIVFKKEDYIKIKNGIMLPVENIKNYDEKNIFKVYSDDHFLGVGKIVERNGRKFLKMIKVLV